jgi:hypothetical protein
MQQQQQQPVSPPTPSLQPTLKAHTKAQTVDNSNKHAVTEIFTLSSFLWTWFSWSFSFLWDLVGAE